MERRYLSSSLTFVYKILFPTLWGGGFGLGTAVGLRQGLPQAREMLIAWLVAMVMFFWTLIPLKVVSSDGCSLFVSNYLRSATIPLSDVADVRESRWLNIHRITIRFGRVTPFGWKITFMPTLDWLAFFRGHLVTKELRALVAAAKEGGKSTATS